MIYKHYKGGLYFVIGCATGFSHDFPAKVIEQVAVATHTETEQQVNVLLVTDNLTGREYYALDTDELDGAYVVYRDLEDNYWIRPKDMFFGNVATVDENNLDKVFSLPRFVRVSNSYLFDIIARC